MIMLADKQVGARPALRKSSRFWGVLGLLLGTSFVGAPAASQELTHRFINPSFGGNPFNSDHLLSIANIGRPKEPQAPGEDPPTEEDLIASQIRARLLSQLTGDILDRIEAAKPGETGEFVFGNQRVNFTKSATETRITFLNLTTGKSNELVVPVRKNTDPFLNNVKSAEQSLGAIGASPGGPLAGSSLLGPPPLGSN
jgi:curli production assembly/transport component CsgF